MVTHPCPLAPSREVSIPEPVVVEEFEWFVSQARAPRRRTMLEFAEAEIVVPGNGPFKGLRFRADRQPFARLLLVEMDGDWEWIICTGPRQSGKTLCGWVIPAMYHLFEIGETVVMMVPDMEMAGDKWRIDLKPAIELSRYRDLIPSGGIGSRGGKVHSITFRNGATLKFMSGAGNEKGLVGYTTRVLIVTEADGMDTAFSTSREADRITQAVHCTDAFDTRRRIYLECTLTTEEGRTYREIKGGTDSRIVLPCPKCGAWVTAGREHFRGWEEAEDAEAARAGGRFHCPECGQPWSEVERAEANRGARLAHRGQTIGPDGEVQGEAPRTRRLGFPWSAVNNLFVSAESVAEQEWRAARAEDTENAEKEMRQFVWAMPWSPQIEELSEVTAAMVLRRVGRHPRGVAPAETVALTASMDLGKHLAHWGVMAWLADLECRVIDYGRLDVASSSVGEERGVLIALRTWRDMLLEGYALEEEETGERQVMVPGIGLIDSGYDPDVVYQFCRESVEGRFWRFRPVKGFGVTQYGEMRRAYREPKKRGGTTRAVGDHYHVTRLQEKRVDLVEFDADWWKTFWHKRLLTPPGEAGAVSLFMADSREHLAFAKHQMAERQVQEFVPGKGSVVRWHVVHRNNHYLDMASMGCLAGHLLGVRMVESRRAVVAKKQGAENRTGSEAEPGGWRTPDGRPYLITQRR